MGTATMQTPLDDFARRYADAWSSQNPDRVAAFFSQHGSLRVNDDPPAVGRAAIAEVARGFMTAFPGMVVTLDKLVDRAEGVEFHWTLTGTNTGPGGTGRTVRISGYEEWQMNADGLVAVSTGHFDALGYQQQLAGG